MGILVFNVILFCLFSNWFLLLLSAAMLLMPVCLILFMKQDIKNTEIAISIKGGWRVDQKSILKVELKTRHGLVAAGLMDLTLQLENLKFKEKKFFEIHFPISSSNRVFEIEYIPKLCGIVELSCTRAMVYDILGLVDLSIKKPETKSITVYPKKVAIQLEKRNDAGSIRDGDQYEKNKKGMDMSDIYDQKLRHVIRRTAGHLEIPLQEGVYIQLTGPNYESPAEVQMCKALGADAVGMSTACEAVAANHMGMQICGISCISNLACGISEQPLNHTEVQEMADKAAPLFEKLVTGCIIDISASLNKK